MCNTMCSSRTVEELYCQVHSQSASSSHWVVSMSRSRVLYHSFKDATKNEWRRSGSCQSHDAYERQYGMSTSLCQSTLHVLLHGVFCDFLWFCYSIIFFVNWIHHHHYHHSQTLSDHLQPQLLRLDQQDQLVSELSGSQLILIFCFSCRSAITYTTSMAEPAMQALAAVIAQRERLQLRGSLAAGMTALSWSSATSSWVPGISSGVSSERHARHAACSGELTSGSRTFRRQWPLINTKGSRVTILIIHSSTMVRYSSAIQLTVWAGSVHSRKLRVHTWITNFDSWASVKHLSSQVGGQPLFHGCWREAGHRFRWLSVMVGKERHLQKRGDQPQVTKLTLSAWSGYNQYLQHLSYSTQLIIVLLSIQSSFVWVYWTFAVSASLRGRRSDSLCLHKVLRHKVLMCDRVILISRERVKYQIQADAFWCHSDSSQKRCVWMVISSQISLHHCYHQSWLDASKTIQSNELPLRSWLGFGFEFSLVLVTYHIIFRHFFCLVYLPHLGCKAPHVGHVTFCFKNV